ncbi:MAG TPA: DbpA RNA binding domain-containing protein [Candidatus Ornithospirochaeta avicola]|uniref:DbpA RNA binding domain-containing protein n=1 Tax=Candidatus Ornithospirochaeta avicola TaxID=2840896 RepID=A0A9D1TMG0_9SPIO|nr:DbpA RNA binding domain-containing protein [Candidatus Ornithospirochaeta avicola]
MEDTNGQSFDESALIRSIEEIKNRIKLDDIKKAEELENIKKVVKKNVPFFMRSAFTAYILREALSFTSGAKKREKKYVRDAKEESAKADIPSDARTLYLNIGKMKHLYAKNLSEILQKELEISRSDIMSIRIHDKYSFITMSQTNCEKAIEKMNGMDINGRKAQISYASREAK